jgi:hypothetical protein
MSRRGQRSMPLWFLSCCIAAFALAVWLLSLGSKGNEIAENLGLPVSIVGILITVVVASKTEQQQPPDEGDPAPRRRSRWPLLLLAMLVGLSAAGTYWVLDERSTINVTSDMAVANRLPMRYPGQLILTVPGSPPQRDRIALTLSLSNPSLTGNCVGPARLVLTRSIDGVSQNPPTMARSGEEVELSLVGATKSATILVEFEIPDPMCSVVVSVERALLFN